MPWFGKRKSDAETGRTRSVEDVQKLMLRFAEERLRAWLNANLGANATPEVNSYAIEDSRVCAEALSFRIYVYDMENPEGQFGYEALQLRSDAAGDVFENAETVVANRKVGYFLYRVHVAQRISLDPNVRERQQRSRETGRSIAGSFHAELSRHTEETEATGGTGKQGSQQDCVAVYVRTTITSHKFDGYQQKLAQFCRQHGWSNPRVYHDRAGGTADEGELQDMARMFGELLSGKGSKTEAESIGRRLAEMGQTDEQHDRDNLHRLMTDIDRGVIRVVVVHDLGQLGKNRMEAFGVLSSLMDKVDVHMPGLGKIGGQTAFPPGSKTDYV